MKYDLTKYNKIIRLENIAEKILKIGMNCSEAYTLHYPTIKECIPEMLSLNKNEMQSIASRLPKPVRIWNVRYEEKIDGFITLLITFNGKKIYIKKFL